MCRSFLHGLHSWLFAGKWPPDKTRREKKTIDFPSSTLGTPGTPGVLLVALGKSTSSCETDVPRSAFPPPPIPCLPHFSETFFLVRLNVPRKTPRLPGGIFRSTWRPENVISKSLIDRSSLFCDTKMNLAIKRRQCCVLNVFCAVVVCIFGKSVPWLCYRLCWCCSFDRMLQIDPSFFKARFRFCRRARIVGQYYRRTLRESVTLFVIFVPSSDLDGRRQISPGRATWTYRYIIVKQDILYWGGGVDEVLPAFSTKYSTRQQQKIFSRQNRKEKLSINQLFIYLMRKNKKPIFLYGTRTCLKVCAPQFCFKVCALSCYSIVDWLIEWTLLALFFHFL